ncbi:MAG TPA: DnaA/Hda family protein, partial [Gaiellaceae bacterium]|nr:DnaA/Hda family protein [Gaiellaceae bacterium]
MEQQTELTAERLWSEVSGRLRGSLNDTTYATWFGEVAGYELAEDTFVLAVPNDFTRDWIEGHFRSLIGAAIRDVLEHELPIELRVVEEHARAQPLGDPTDSPHGERQATVAPVVHRLHTRPDSGVINTKYTFDSFVIGSSNRFAHAAALAVAEAPAQAYNPLFIYGGTGLGKTHLLQAIAQYVSEHSQHLSVRYVTSETFMNDFINSLRDKRIEGFKQRYRTYDVLLIDDVQFFEHKERIQEEFFHTFNSLYEAGSQIVMSS